MFKKYAELTLAVNSKDVVKGEKALDKFGKEAKQAERATDSLGKVGKLAFGGLAAAVAGVSSAALLRNIVQNTQTQQKAISQLRQTLNTTGNAVGQNLDQLIERAGELQNITVFGDEIIIGAQSKLATFTNVASSQFDRATLAALDLSTAMEQDLKSSVLQIGKALNDPVKGLTALSRSGTQFSQEQTDLIKSLAEAGRMAEAQAIILSELEKQYGGSAKAARETGGAFDALRNAAGDLLEADGESLTELNESVETLTSTLQDPETARAVQTLTSEMLDFAGALARAAAKGVGLTAFLTNELKASFGSIADDDLPRLEDRLAGVNKAIDDLANSPLYIAFFDEGKLKSFQAEAKELEDRIKAAKNQLEEDADPIVRPQASEEQRQPDVQPRVSSDDFEDAFGNESGRFLQLQDQLDQEEEFKKEADEKERERELARLDFRKFLVEQTIAESDRELNAIVDATKKQDAVRQASLEVAGSVFGGIAALAKEGSKAQRAALAAEQGMAIAQATINLYKAISDANTAPWYITAATVASAVTTGKQAIDGISGVSGQFHDGGVIPYDGTFYMQKGEVVTPTKEVPKLKGGNVSVTVINNAPGVEHSVQRVSRGEREEIIIEAVERSRESIAEGALRGGDSVADSFAQGFGLQRAGSI